MDDVLEDASSEVIGVQNVTQLPTSATQIPDHLQGLYTKSWEHTLPKNNKKDLPASWWNFKMFALTKEQKKHCTTRKELLAVVWFVRQYRYCLLGNLFTVRTDHASLTWLLRFREPKGQLARWIEELSRYKMILKHRAGKGHQNADALSRLTTGVCKALSDLPCGGSYLAGE